MGARLRLILVVAIILVVVIALIIVGYRFDWTGFNGNNKSSKTLWDWLQLLIIPVVLAVAGYAINLTISRSEQIATERRAETDRYLALSHAEIEREIAHSNHQEAALKAYFDDMTQLILHENLHKSEPGTAIRLIARTRTLTILSRLDPVLRRTVIQFLLEASLILKDNSFVDLRGADIRKAYLSSITLRETNFSEAWMDGVDLQGGFLKGAKLKNAIIRRADLREADLREAVLCYANLNETDLSGADLTDADLEGADLSGANLTDTDLSNTNLKYANMTGAIVTDEQLKQAKSLKGATMHDGSIQP